VLLHALVLLVAGTAGPPPMTAARTGMWAARAAYLWPGPTAIVPYPEGGRAIDVRSPDGRSVVEIRENRLSLRDGGGLLLRNGAVADLAEVLWAPDSHAFVVTESDGGWMGGWDVTEFRIAGRSVKRSKIGRKAFREFSQRKTTYLLGYPPPGGCTMECPNIGAVGWVNGSQQLVVVAEAPNHSSCCDMGTVLGYLLDASTGVILRRYQPDALGKEFAEHLGSRFVATQEEREP